MDVVLAFVRTYEVVIVTGGLLVLLVLTGVQMIRINVIRKKLESTVREVRHYLDWVMEDEGKAEKVRREQQRKEQEREKSIREDQQNRLITAVLEEIFP